MLQSDLHKLEEAYIIEEEVTNTLVMIRRNLNTTIKTISMYLAYQALVRSQLEYAYTYASVIIIL